MREGENDNGEAERSASSRWLHPDGLVGLALLRRAGKDHFISVHESFHLPGCVWASAGSCPPLEKKLTDMEIWLTKVSELVYKAALQHEDPPPIRVYQLVPHCL